jgi:hypothetical protein
MKFRLIATTMIATWSFGCSQPVRQSSQADLQHPSQPGGQTTQSENHWSVNEFTNAIDGVKTVVISTDSTGSDPAERGTLNVRFTGRKLDVFVSVDEFIENGNVRVRFDNRAPIRQSWGRATDLKGVFSNQPHNILEPLEQASKFYIEIQPSGRMANTLVFDVSGLADALPPDQAKEVHDAIAEQAARSQAEASESASNRVKYAPYVRPCTNEPSMWCWQDPSIENAFSPPFATKDEAIESAAENAKAGVAFRSPMQ